MYLLACLFFSIGLHVIYLNRTVWCQSADGTGYECGSCDNVTVADSESYSTGWLGRLNERIISSDLAKLTLRKGLNELREIWNSQRILKFSVFPNEKSDHILSVKFLRPDDNDVTNENEVAGRTFGIRRRMQLLLFLPISFKLGVIMTLLLVLTAMSLKTLIIAVIILLLILANTHAYSKLWATPKTAAASAELTDFYHSNLPVHIHLHSPSPPMTEDHHHRPFYVEHQQHSPSYVYQRNWHESSPTTDFHV